MDSGVLNYLFCEKKQNYLKLSLQYYTQRPLKAIE